MCSVRSSSSRYGCGVRAEGAAVRVRPHHLHVAGCRRHQLARLTDAGSRLRAVMHAVVGVAQRQELVVARVGAGDEDGEVHRLGATVHEVRHPVRSFGQGGDQLLGEVARLRVVIRRGDVRQLLHLLAHGGEHARMRVADADADVLRHAVEVAPAVVVPQVLAAAALPYHRIVVADERRERGGEEPAPACGDGLGVPVKSEGWVCRGGVIHQEARFRSTSSSRVGPAG